MLKRLGGQHNLDRVIGHRPILTREIGGTGHVVAEPLTSIDGIDGTIGRRTTDQWPVGLGTRAHIQDRAGRIAQGRLEIPPNGHSLQIQPTQPRYQPAP